MREVFRYIYLFLIIIGIGLASNTVDFFYRAQAQKNEIIYQVMLTVDLASFMSNGGGSFGYNNYFKVVLRHLDQRTGKDVVAKSYVLERRYPLRCLQSTEGLSFPTALP